MRGVHTANSRVENWPKKLAHVQLIFLEVDDTKQGDFNLPLGSFTPTIFKVHFGSLFTWYIFTGQGKLNRKYKLQFEIGRVN